MGVTTGSLKLGNVWKVIREFDLDEIRREALAPFDLAILGEPAHAERIRAALSPGGAASPHRFEWVFAVADGGLSTPQVYAECDRLRDGRVLPEPRVSDAMMSALRSAER